MVLQTLQWEISTVTSMDFLEYILMRIQQSKNTSKKYFHDDKAFESQLEELKLKMEQVLVLAVTDYSFSYLSPSLLAASAARLILSRLDTKVEIMAEICKSIGAISVSHTNH